MPYPTPTFLIHQTTYRQFYSMKIYFSLRMHPSNKQSHPSGTNPVQILTEPLTSKAAPQTPVENHLYLNESTSNQRESSPPFWKTSRKSKPIDLTKSQVHADNPLRTTKQLIQQQQQPQSTYRVAHPAAVPEQHSPSSPSISSSCSNSRAALTK